MTAETVAILSPGDMGHAVGRALRLGGHRVITCLQGRSSRSAALAARGGFETVPDDDTLVREADVCLSIVAPAGAAAVGERVAAALARTGAGLLYVECNAIAPATVRTIAERIGAAGGRFVDAGIIGGPPKADPATSHAAGPRFYASGQHAGEFARRLGVVLDVRPIGSEIGQASGLKMCYAALTKGLTALATELLVAGELLGLGEPLRAELRDSQATLLGVMERSIPGMPPKAYRWIDEMEQIAATFEALGLTPRLLLGAADMYRFVERTPLGRETPEQRSQGQTLDDAIAVLAAALREHTPAPAD